MKKVVVIMTMCLMLVVCGSCGQPKVEAETTAADWILDSFDDIKILRYEVPGFEQLEMGDKLFIYYMSQAALCGRDILFDQNCRYNLPVRRTLEVIYEGYEGKKEGEEWEAFEKYLKKVWFANGIHHHYSGDKFKPGFSQEYFAKLVEATPGNKFPDDFGSVEELLSIIEPVMFDEAIMPLRINQRSGDDMLLTSAMNYYQDVKQSEAEAFYGNMAKKDPYHQTPIMYGLNSKLVKEDGKLVERVWKVGGMYSAAIEKIAYWLEMAKNVANPRQAEQLKKLIKYYQSGDLKDFDDFNILWVQDAESNVDYINGFTEVYGDPLGYKASWESMVNFKNIEATKRTSIISTNAQWFEDNSPVDARFKKEEVRGVTAKVITIAMLGGDCYPATPIGVNLPNSDWIRKDYGSKSVTIENITYAYSASAKGDGFLQEFMLREEDRARIEKYGSLADNLHTDLHECLGHGSGQLAPGVKGDELRNYGSVLEETRADLFALYYLGDEKMLSLGLIPSMDAAKAEYAKYVMNGMMTQFSRIEFGRDVEQAHMRNRKLISEWCYERGKADNVIEKIVENDKTYIVVNDFDKLRELFGELLKEMQRIKSTGDYNAGKNLVETYAIKIDPELHRELLDRYNILGLVPYSGFVNPVYNPVMVNGEIVDIKLEYRNNYVEQMLDYSKNYSFLPSRN